MYFVGAVIKREREKRNISQEELCFGICAVSTLSRIERNEQTPTMEKAMALMSRLGLEGSRYMSFATEEEYRIYRIRRNTENMLVERRYAEAYDYLLRYRDELMKNNFRRQFFLCVKAAKLCYVDKQYETAITLTEEAIRCTCPPFDKDKKIRYLLNDAEVNVINMMAVSYWRSGRHVTATNLLINLTEAIGESEWEADERQLEYPMILCNLSKWMCSQLRFEEAEHYIELGRQACIQSGRFRMLPYLCCNEAAVMQSREENTETVLSEYINAYILFKNMKLSADAEALHSFVLKTFHRDLEKLTCPESNPT